MENYLAGTILGEIYISSERDQPVLSPGQHLCHGANVKQAAQEAVPVRRRVLNRSSAL